VNYRTRLALLLAGFMASLAALAAGGHAAGGVQVRGVDASSWPIVRLSVVTPSPSKFAPTLKENGQPVSGLTAQNLGLTKSVVLAVDRSQSMAGSSLRNAAAGARAFVAAKPRADRIEVVTFGSRALSLTAFSASTLDANDALRSLNVDAKQGTALYDAVALGSEALGNEAEPGRVLIVLTDGRDTSSTSTLQDAIRSARKAGVAVYTLAIASPDFTSAPLRELARGTGGAYYQAATSEEVAQIYSSIARELRRTWRLSYMTSVRPGKDGKLAASVAGAGSGSASLHVPGSITDPGRGHSLFPKAAYTGSSGTLLIALTVGGLFLLAGMLFVTSRRRAWVKERLEPHISAARALQRAQDRERFAMASGLFKTTENAFGGLRQWRSAQRLLERADLPLRTVELFYIMIGAAMAGGLVGAVGGLPSWIILAAMIGAGSLPYCFVVVKAKRRLKAFETQLPDLLITMAASLKAGHSFRQGIQTIVDEGQDPAAGEFRRVLTDTSLGRPMEDALADMAERAGSKNFEFVITAVTIQRQVGGSLAGLFDMVAETVRQRQQFARKIRSLTAMGRMSAYVLIGLPFVIAFAITLLNSEYMAPLYHTPKGHFLVGLMLVLMAFGSLILKKIVSFKG
jgi:tight adherence protein B